jgi:hypothetical protein
MSGPKSYQSVFKAFQERLDRCKNEDSAKIVHGNRSGISADSKRAKQSGAYRLYCGYRQGSRKRGADNVTAIKQQRTPKAVIQPQRRGYIEIEVELPRGTMSITRRTFWVPREAKASAVKNNLAKHFKVSGGSWNLYTSRSKDETPTLLGMDEEINQYSRDKSRLYFYPNVIF